VARRYRLIIWGPGEVGGATLRAAHASDRFEIVGVKVFSRHKDGKDAGELVGIGPIGVRATRSRREILALEADCVIMTPQPRAVLEGLDDDVIALLESGKSVVSTAAYHDVAMRNWFNRARSPTARLRAIANTPGAAARTWERWALALVRAITSVRALDPVTDLVLRPVADRRIPARARADRLIEACQRGRSALHGTGVHPTFMVERLLMRMCRSLSRVSHIRFMEAGDFARAPEGMWGGLAFFGFGRDPRQLGDDWVVAKAGDFYYGDLIGNVAHALYGAAPDDVRVERSLRGIPAVRDLQVGATRIRAGMTAALHLVHRGYLGDHPFFTNEECWYLGAENAYHGGAVPFGTLPAHGGYTFDVTSEAARVRGQMAFPTLCAGRSHPITILSVNALLDAVEPVCRAAPGIIIDDAGPAYRHGDAGAPPIPQARRAPYRIAATPGDSIGRAVIQAAQGDPRFAVIAAAQRAEWLTADVDCVVVTADSMVPASDVDAMILALLERGKNVVSTAHDQISVSRLRDACERGGATIHRIGLLATWAISRMAMTMIQGLTAVRHVRVVEARDLAATPERRQEAAALGLGRVAGDTDGEMSRAGDGNLVHVIASVARELYAAAEADIRVERAQRQILAEQAFAVDGDLTIGPGTVVAICTLHRGYLRDRHFFTSEDWRYLGPETAHYVADLPYDGIRGPTSYAVQIQADPADLASQWELEPAGAADPIADACARMVLDAIGPVCEAAPGILLEDPRPRYRHDERVE